MNQVLYECIFYTFILNCVAITNAMRKFTIFPGFNVFQLYILHAVSKIKMRWKTLRDRYVREKKKLASSGFDISTSTWKYMKRLTFLECGAVSSR